MTLELLRETREAFFSLLKIAHTQKDEELVRRYTKEVHEINKRIFKKILDNKK